MRSISPRAAAACALAPAALALAACTSSSSQAQPGPGSTTVASGGASAKPADGGSYGSGSEVISALKSAGHPCTPVSNSGDTDIKAPGLQSVAACTTSSSGSSSTGGAVTATVFDNHADAVAYATVLTSSQASGLLIGGTSERAVVGRNWVVLVPDDAAYAQQVSSALGGTLVSSTSSPAS